MLEGMNLLENPFDLCKLIHKTNNIVINLEIFLDVQDTEQKKEKQSSNKPM